MIAPPSPAPTFRGDIEGLRAIAVLAVLAYHANLGPFHGGYIGVDVFFVISGYLITSLLIRDLQRSGSKALPAFWARRARRLLPGSFVVVAATLVAGRLLLDPLAQRDLMRDGLAVTTFTVNIVFAHRQSDYLASQLAPSPLLHFWSLALEEQFYIVWPLLLLAATAFRRRVRWLPMALIGVLLATSLVLCLRLTAHHQPASFFLLPTRAWELLAGAALAAAGTAPKRIHAAVRNGAGWLGLAIVVVAAVRFSDLTLFPGSAATVPVAATVLVLVAGAGARGDGYGHGPGRLLDIRPLRWVGTRSYGIYLWHWPVLVLAAARFGPLDAVQRVSAVLIAVCLAAVSFRVVENPARRSTWLAARSRRSLVVGATLGLSAAALATTMLVLMPSLDGGRQAASPLIVIPETATTATAATTTLSLTTASSMSAPTTTAAQTPTTTATPTTGPATSTTTPEAAIAAMVEANVATLQQGATDELVPSNLTPGLGQARSDKPQIYADGCILSNGVITKQDCIYGDTTSATTIVLFGDSHAAQWFPALQDIAVRNHWRLDVRTKKGCPTADVPIADPARGPECGPWRDAVMTDLAAEQPDLIIMSAYRYKTTSRAIGSSPDDVWRNGLQTTLDKMRPLARNVLVLGDTPTPLSDVPGCVASHRRHISACMNPRSAAIKPGRLAVERDLAIAHDATFVPTGDWLCSTTDCPVIIGNLLVYRDNSHITTAASMWLAPYLESAVKPLLSG